MNWKHSFYELYAMTFGQAFTIDEAHRLLSEQREDRLFSIASSFAESKRAQAKVIDAKVTQRDYAAKAESKSNLRRSEAFILETEARFIIARPCLDMARAELAFIESLIQYIDDNNLRSHARPEVAYQYVQEMEIAFDLIWQLAYDGPHSALMRNIFAHPKGEEIVQVTQQWKEALPSRKAVSESLAKIYSLHPTQLAITVNVYEKLKTAIQSDALAAYQVSSQKSTVRLEETVLAQSSGSPAQSIGVESSD
ncbi:hypothetical protein D3C85_333840 [compost metagenome]